MIASSGTETKKEGDREKILVDAHTRYAKTIVFINKGWILPSSTIIRNC